MSIVLVAERAGVSIATVSRVLNNYPGVREKTKKQVTAALQELNYVTPSIKRGPRQRVDRKNRSSHRTDTIAVVAICRGKHWLQLPVMAATVSGITRAAGESNLKVLLLDETDDYSKFSPLLAQGGIDGAVAFLASDMKLDGLREALSALQLQVPVVWAMGGDAGIPLVDHVAADDQSVARLAFDYLIQNKCTELAFLCASPKWPMMRSRGQFFANLAHDAGVNCSPYLVGEDPSDGDLFGRRTVVERNLGQLVDRLVTASPRPDGLFVGNDAMTVLIYPLLLQRGITPGKDILLISCDNEETRLDGLEPRPLSIDIGAAEVGAVAVRRLCYRIEHPDEPPVIIKVAPSIPGGITLKSGQHGFAMPTQDSPDARARL